MGLSPLIPTFNSISPPINTEIEYHKKFGADLLSLQEAVEVLNTLFLLQTKNFRLHF